MIDQREAIATTIGQVLFGTAAAVILATTGYWALRDGQVSRQAPDPIAPSISAASNQAAAATAAATEEERTPDEIAEDKARDLQLVLEPQVRAALCEDYAARYLKASSGTALIKSIQLSQAAGCGWDKILQADVATHDFLPEPLAVAQRMEAREVPTAGSQAMEDADKIDRMADKLDDVERKVEDVRRRVAYIH